MSNSRVRSLTIRTSAWQAWLRLLLAAFVLAFYTAIALAGGVAHADDDPAASGGETGKPSAATSQQSASAGSASRAAPKQAPHTGSGLAGPAGSTAGPTPDAGPPGSVQASQHDAPKAHVSGDTWADPPKTTGTGAPTAAGPQQEPTSDPFRVGPAGAGATAQTPGTADPPPPAGAATMTPEAAQPTVPDEVPPDFDAAGVQTASVTPLATDRSNKSKRPGASPSVAPAAAAESSTAVTTAPDVRSARSSVTPAPATSTGSAIVPLSDPVLANQSQAAKQLAGSISDAATLVVSAIHSVATTVAQAFGQQSFLGVPYLLATTVANAAAAVGRTLVGAPLIDPTAGPFTVNYGILDTLAFFNPTKPPAGANDRSISVTAEHPLPIILLNGTTTTQGFDWPVGPPVLADAGYKVYTFNYGNTTGNPNTPIQAIGDIRQSGLELAAEVDRVLAETGAPQVILIGHSQGGGILPVYYINDLGGAAKVSQLIGIAPSNHGTDLGGLLALQALPILGPLVVGIADAVGPALYQQAVGSAFQQEVYGNGDTRPGVLYTTIASVNDEVVTPYTQQALTGPNVTNVVLQDQHPGLVAGHGNIVNSPYTWGIVLDALANNAAASPLLNRTTSAA